MEDAHNRREIEIPIYNKLLDLGVIETDIANANPRFEFKEEDQDATLNETVNDQVKETEVVIISNVLDPTAATTSCVE